MSKEDFFISQFTTQTKQIGDDGAVIKLSTFSDSENLVFVKDGFFENIHFKRDWFSLEQIAYKSILVNVSDLIAMNSKPKYALLNVAIPKDLNKKELIELANGFKNISKKFNIEIIGGDTIANDKLDITVTLVGEVEKNQKTLYRSGIKNGDLIAHTGTIGSVKKDLDKLLKNKKIKNKKSKFTNIEAFDVPLNYKFIKKIRKYISAGMDISDGIFTDLERLAKINNLNFKLNKKISKKMGCSGEEYELLFAFSPKNLKKLQKIFKKSRYKFTVFAKAVNQGKYKNLCRPHHF
jgi:thiamine-monophosphate kinase